MMVALAVGIATTAIVSGVRFGARIATLEAKMEILEGSIKRHTDLLNDALARIEAKFDKFLDRCDRRHEE